MLDVQVTISIERSHIAVERLVLPSGTRSMILLVRKQRNISLHYLCWFCEIMKYSGTMRVSEERMGKKSLECVYL